MSIYNKKDVVGIYVRAVGRRGHHVKFESPKVRIDVTRRLETMKRRFNISYCYARTEKGTII
ncbi:hypothetical protein NVP1072O_50 [Vibrio phage 1.072.O._10N.286.48.A12]|nr:hypothetical protein NVP1004O_49 [Vibrio phage 1.004.O._10N.261.54.A2]AUR83609.1 hypothetical protein NVP1037O_49 [Vibrio phage 1.037.O._10N.261.52.F7]AUR84494.1 hypothetical protein NVP1056O_52 [Vibrio phage 1.056.O._10N.261.48.C11]AUR85011.1 hypothetical protein NVP1066O_52 [Vibrio phage 1.066.O._10N.286.46.E8]AUR85142.1 hypothetical protein NVP1068O_52 [Vibrio phage 1.068.O._10N.261.51.F8]AUR85367.1 hypothetical protein NVP1072O_50 [Vibrio phage 1.072.O._10N.286.48.A12]